MKCGNRMGSDLIKKMTSWEKKEEDFELVSVTPEESTRMTWGDRRHSGRQLPTSYGLCHQASLFERPKEL